MRLQVKGKNVEVSESIRLYAEEKLHKLDRQLHELTHIDPWFLQQFSQIAELRRIAGMQEFLAGALRKYGKKFAELTASQKDQYFGELLAAAEGGATAPRTPFVVLMKRLTIFGYYTSELGATTELHQQIATARYEPAAVVKPGDRADSGIPGAMYWFNAG